MMKVEARERQVRRKLEEVQLLAQHSPPNEGVARADIHTHLCILVAEELGPDIEIDGPLDGGDADDRRTQTTQ